MNEKPPRKFGCRICGRRHVPIEWKELEPGGFIGRSVCRCGAIEAHVYGDPEFTAVAQGELEALVRGAPPSTH